MDIRRLDLNLLLLLDGLLTSGNLSATARQLGISQPSASAGLAKLRHFFQDDLFVRTGRGLRPTPFAQDIEKSVRSVIEKISHDILRQPVFDPQASNRSFTLTMPDLGEVIFLPPILAKLHAAAPGVTLKCIYVPYADVAGALEDGILDLAIGFFPDLMEPTIRSQMLYEDPMVCIARKDHPDVNDTMSLDEFRDLEHLVFERQGRQESFANWNAEHGLARRAVLQIPHFMSMPRLVAATNMVSVIPLSLASSFLHQYGLQIFQPPVALASISLKQYWHRRMQNEPGVGWLRGVVADCLVGKNPHEGIWVGREPAQLRH